MFLPGLGTLLSSAVTPLVACSVLLLKKRGVFVYICAAVMLLFVSPGIAVEFLLTTGLSGLTLGLSFRRKPVFTFLISSVALLAGVFCLTYTAGSAALDGMFGQLPLVFSIPLFAGFAMLYTCAWRFILKRLSKLPALHVRLQN
jgi:hypothetical protein